MKRQLMGGGVGAPALLLLWGCQELPPPPPPPSAEAYQAEMEAWRANRVRELKEPDSWLSVVDLHWMMPGETRIGSAPDMDLVLPGEEVPEWIGTLTLRGQGTFEYTLSPEASEQVEEDEAVPLEFRVDTQEPPPVMRWGTYSWFVIERYGEFGIRVKNSAAPAFDQFHGLESFPTEQDWRVVARFEPYDPPREITVPNVLDIPATSMSPGAAVFELEGREYRLDLTGDPSAASLFLVFGDATNGGDTYGGDGSWIWHPRTRTAGSWWISTERTIHPAFSPPTPPVPSLRTRTSFPSR